MLRLLQAEDRAAPDVRLRPRDVASFAAANLRFMIRNGLRLRGTHRPPVGHRVPEDFAGICVASSPDPACDAYVLDRLREMGVRHVRLDFTYGSEARHTARFLDYLLDNSISVLLHLFQPHDEGVAMDTPAARERWRDFLEQTLDRWGGRVEAVEVGSTVNRRKWAGYTPETFFEAWRIAHDIVRNRSMTLAGPNVTDFEPVYNVALLARMQAEGRLPDIHTNNLFAERAVEPERHDHKILGRTLAGAVKFNLIKKARWLHSISESVGVERTWSTHAAWSKRRINRVLPDVEEKQADYLARYFILMAASGAMSRVYWGPMIGQREGIVGDGTDEYPERFPHVMRYEHVYGDVSAYTTRPALRAMRAFVRLIPGARYDGALTSADGLEAHAFSGPRGVVHAMWTTDGRGADLASMHRRSDLAGAQWFDRDGAKLPDRPTLITESPVYAMWPSGDTPSVDPDARPIHRLVVRAPVRPYQDGDWRGVVDAPSDEDQSRLLETISPDRVRDVERIETLREARNTVWRIADPINEGESLVVKRWLMKPWHKKALDYWKPSRARRSWNAACELLRRGVDTPRPVAFFERTGRAVLKENFYICAHSPGGMTVRSFFTAYATGETEYDGVPADEFYERLAGFFLNMHRRGVYYRDLSPGNILVVNEGGRLRFSLVDTTRARFYTRPATLRQSLADLKRVCHPLDWEGRMRFVGTYLDKRGERFTARRRFPFRLYDFKQRAKQGSKRWRRRLALGAKLVVVHVSPELLSDAMSASCAVL